MKILMVLIQKLYQEVSIKGFIFGFQLVKKFYFSALNCTIPSGGIVVINGFNSAGKTSLCKAILGLVLNL